MQRLESLDVLRGLTIAAMILVSTPGSWDHVFVPLTHARWHDTTPTDLVFPFFVFMVGVSVSVSFGRKQKRGDDLRKSYPKILLRFIKLMLLGIFLNMYPVFDFANYGWFGVGYTGVLPRLGIVYLACTVLFIETKPIEWMITSLVILLGYWVLLMFVKPLDGSWNLEPGTNLVHQLDQRILHLEQGQWVPEGFMSTFPAIVTGAIGMICGRILEGKENMKSKVLKLFTMGFGILVISVIWSWQFPDNKNLWTSTFVLESGGYSIIALAALTYVIDILGYNRFSGPARIFGMNAITMYVLFHVLHPLFLHWPIGDSPINVHFMSLLTREGVAPKLVSLLFALAFTWVCYLIALVMYHRKIFIRL